jgi:hypothetical protein
MRQKEILVARTDHDDDQIGRKGEVDELENADNHVRRLRGRDLHHEFSKLQNELVDQRRKTKDEAYQEWCHQPSAGEDNHFEDRVNLLHCSRASRFSRTIFTSLAAARQSAGAAAGLGTDGTTTGLL